MKRNKEANPLQTILVITVGFLVIAMVAKVSWALYVSLGVGLLGLASGAAAKFIDYLWYKLAAVLALIVPNILMGVIFYLILTPIAILSRLFGAKDQLTLKNTKKSMFRDVDRVFDNSYFEKPW